MEKIIVRSNPINIAKTRTKIIHETSGQDITVEDLLKQSRHSLVVNEFFEESLPDMVFEETPLYHAFQEAQKCLPHEVSKSLAISEPNTDFYYMYLLNEQFAVHLTSHVYMCKVMKRDELIGAIVPWYNYSKVTSFGMTAWRSDKEILDDISRKTVFDFVTEYNALA